MPRLFRPLLRTVRCQFALALCLLALLLAAIQAKSASAEAQTYPNRAIKIIVGPSPDIFSRVIAQELQDAWGQPVVVEPRPGAGGKIAASAVSGAEPDGYTLLFATPTYTLNTAMKLASYDLAKDFEPVSLLGLISYVLVVNPQVPAKSVAELVALAKSKPGGLNCASAGFGTVPQLACELLNKSAGVQIVHVPYRDVNSAMGGTVGGHVQMFFGVSANSKQQIKAGTVRGLAVTTEQRSSLLPDLPTMVESGFPRFIMPGWGGFLAPAHTPRDVVDKLNAEIRRILQKPEVREKFANLGMEPPPPYTSVQFGEFIRNDIARWTNFVNIVGLEKLRDTR